MRDVGQRALLDLAVLAITDATRDVVYPSQMYASATSAAGVLVTPRVNQSALLGPDLKMAYQLLGVLANYLNSNKNPNPPNIGFFSVGSVTTVF
jgi:hypothetical protein